MGIFFILLLVSLKDAYFGVGGGVAVFMQFL